MLLFVFVFFFQAEDGIRDVAVTGVQTCALPICRAARSRRWCAHWRSGGARFSRVGTRRRGDARRLGAAFQPEKIERHQIANGRSEEHTSELQSRLHLVCRLLLEKKKKKTKNKHV